MWITRSARRRWQSEVEPKSEHQGTTHPRQPLASLVTRIALRPAIKEKAQLQGNGLPACLVKGKQEQQMNGFRIPLEPWHYGRETTNAGTSAGKTISKVNSHRCRKPTILSHSENAPQMIGFFMGFPHLMYKNVDIDGQLTSSPSHPSLPLRPSQWHKA